MKQRRQFDLVVIGADAPGLAAAACAARAHPEVALKVALIRTGDEPPPGPVSPGVPDFVWRKLDLHLSSLKAKPIDAMVSLFDEGRTLSTGRNTRRTGRALEASGADPARLWADYIEAQASVLEEADGLQHAAAKGAAPILAALAAPKGVRLAERLTRTCGDMLDDHFASEELKLHLASAALMPLGLGGDEPGSALALAAFGDQAAWRVSTGDREAGLLKALEEVCATAGVVIFESAVRDIQVSDEKVRLVMLDNGEALKAPAVMAARASSEAAARLGAAPAFSPLARREGACAEVRVKFARPPAPPNGAGDALFFAAGSRETLKAARDAALEGRIPDEPPIYFRIVKDEIVVTAPYCPAALYADDERRDWSEQDRQALGRRIVERLGAVINGDMKNVRRIDVKVSQREAGAGAVGAGPARLVVPPAGHDEIGAAARLAMELVRGG